VTDETHGGDTSCIRQWTQRPPVSQDTACILLSRQLSMGLTVCLSCDLSFLYNSNITHLVQCLINLVEYFSVLLAQPEIL
jgi:hypothetical protein